MNEVNTNLQGTWAYGARELIDKGDLTVGKPVSLLREPDNPHDRNAIAAFYSKQRIGYIPRNLAAAVADYIDNNGAWAATVSHIGERKHRNKKYPTISLSLSFPDMHAPSGLQALYSSCRLLNGISGVYRIENMEESKAYIGSSSDVGDRLRRHINQLRSGTHANLGLSASWSKYGPKTFNVQLIERADASTMKSREAAHIAQLGTHVSGFNRTADGGGTKPAPSQIGSAIDRRRPIYSPGSQSEIRNPGEPTGCLAAIVAAAAFGSYWIFPL